MSTIINQLKKHLLLLIIIFGFAFRFFGLNQIPASPYWEEAALGYDAYSILKTGKDHHGHPFPLVAFESFGDYKPSLYFYILVPFIKVFGLNPFAVRLPSTIAGTLTILFVYMISKYLHPSKKIPLLSALLVAFSPWAIHFSRVGFEVNAATMLLTLGILFGVKSSQKGWWLILSSITLAFSMYAYHSLRIIAPLMGMALLMYSWKKTSWLQKITSLIIALLLILPIIFAFNDPAVTHRFAETSVFSQSNAVIFSNQLRAVHGNSFISRIIYHRYWFYGKEILGHYLQHFNPKFLFWTGDGNPRHGFKPFGLLYLFQLVVLPLGCVATYKHRKYALIIFWITIVPIAAALALPTPHTLRVLPMMPALALISALGIFKLIRINHKLIWVVAAIWVMQGSWWLHQYFTHYADLSAPDWQYGYQQVVAYTESVKDKYNHIYFTRNFGRPAMYVMFYGHYDPRHIQSLEKTTPKDQSEFLSLDQYVFTDDLSKAEPGSLVVSSFKPEYGTFKFTVHIPNSEQGFYIYEI